VNISIYREQESLIPSSAHIFRRKMSEQSSNFLKIKILRNGGTGI